MGSKPFSVYDFDKVTNKGAITLDPSSVYFKEMLEVLRGSKPRQYLKPYWYLTGETNFTNAIEKLNTIYKEGEAQRSDYSNLLNYCWKGSLENWLHIGVDVFLSEMMTNFEKTLTAKTQQSSSCVAIWRAEYTNLYEDLNRVNETFPGFNIIFEYSIPETSNSRPDILLVSKNKVLIIEYKNHTSYKDIAEEAAFQVSVYYRELSEMHVLSSEASYYSFVFFGNEKNYLFEQRAERDDFYFCNRGQLYACICNSIPKETIIIPCDVDEWMNSPFEPRPDILKSAQLVFEGRKNLRDISIVNSTDIPSALKQLQKGISFAEKEKKHVISFVSGVPGAGKTYLGLQLVYDNLEHSRYYSGNRPLVEVLQSRLKNDKTIRLIHGFIGECRQVSQNPKQKKLNPKVKIFVFDEGQRAWEEGTSHGKPEPEILMETLKELEWCFFVVLVGDGQAIYKNEATDLSVWADALNSRTDTWTVMCPEKYMHYFSLCNKRDYLQLNVPLRQITLRKKIIRSEDFVNLLLLKNPNKDEIRKIVKKTKKGGFEIVLTRNFEEAKNTVKKKFENLEGKSYGIISSTQNGLIKKEGLGLAIPANRRNPRLKDVKYSAWYDVNNKNSCRKLEAYVDEIGCQGLDLDYTILYWGPDLRWNNSTDKWETYNVNNGPLCSKDAIYRINSYRVLLTRARYGMTIYIPPVPMLDDTYKLLEELIL